VYNITIQFIIFVLACRAPVTSITALIHATAMEKINVLYVDDEANNLEVFKSYFRRYYNVSTADSADTARMILSAREIHVLITDQKMPVTAGTQLLEEAIQAYPQQTRILLTAYAENEAILDAFQRGLIFKYVLKPYVPEKLKEIIDGAFKVYQLRQIKEQLYREWVKTQEELNLLRMKTK
jgi:DNA-binding NtrC family response regulator